MASATQAESLADAGETLQGPDEAFRRYFKEIHRGLRRFDVPESLIDDAVQDVFLVVFRRWNEFEGRSSLRTWVWGIAARVAAEYRARRLSNRQRMARLSHEPIEGPSTPERVAEQEQATRIVLSVLQQMAQPQREIIVCVALEGFTVAESARILGIPATTAYSRYDKAMERFSGLVRRLTLTAGGRPP